jgi:hypothetical protein
MDLVVGAAVPALFKCPISLELMRDPVVLSTGQSYERSSIEPWLEAGNHTCPATMQKLSSLELVPNHTLRRLIQNWCEAHGSALGMAPISTPKLPLTADTMAAILEELLVQTSCTSRQQLMDPLPILKKMRSLARESERNRKCMEDSDAVSVLASMITTSAAAAAAATVAVEELPMPLPVPAPLQEGGAAATAGLDLVLYHRKLEAACEEALAVLALLDVQGAAANSTRSNRPRSELLTPRSVTAIAWFLCKGRSLEAKVNAATILAGIMAAAAPSTEADQRREYSSHGNNNNNNLGVQIPAGVLEALTKLLREDLYPKAIRASLKAMLTLCIAARRNRIKLVEVGVVPLLIELLPDAAAAAAASGRSPRRSSNNSSSISSSSNAVQELALGVLELVCSTAEGRAAVADHALAMAALVHHLHTVSSLATELSVAILWWVCSKGGAGASSSSSSSSDCLLAAQQSGAFAALLLLLQLDCSPGTRVKARELLKLLQQTSWNYYHSSHHSTTSPAQTPTPTILCDLSSQLGTITGPYLIHNS